MDPSNADEKSRKVDHPPPYNADMGYPPPQAQGGYPSAPAQYGAQPNPSQPAVNFQNTVQNTIIVGSGSSNSNPVPDHLCYSICTTLFCCLPLGIAAFIYSIKTRDAKSFGDRDKAMRKSRMSRLLNNIALGLGIITYITTIILIILSNVKVI